MNEIGSVDFIHSVKDNTPEVSVVGDSTFKLPNMSAARPPLRYHDKQDTQPIRLKGDVH